MVFNYMKLKYAALLWNELDFSFLYVLKTIIFIFNFSGWTPLTIPHIRTNSTTEWWTNSSTWVSSPSLGVLLWSRFFIRPHLITQLQAHPPQQCLQTVHNGHILQVEWSQDQSHLILIVFLVRIDWHTIITRLKV